MELAQSSVVARNLFRKRDLMLRGDSSHERIRSLLIICGGGMRGVYGDGGSFGLASLGSWELF